MPPVHSVPDRMLRREDVLAARLKVWKSRTDETGFSRFGDVVASKPRDEKDEGSPLWRYGLRLAGPVIGPLLEAVVFRPHLTAHKDLSYEDGGRYDYNFNRGSFIILWGSKFGHPASRQCVPFEGPHHYCVEIVSDVEKS